MHRLTPGSRTPRTVLSVAVSFVMAATLTVAVATPGEARPPKAFLPGAPGVGDPYFPLDGNGGYDVWRYLLDVKYDPDTDLLTGVATIVAKATQNLSSFNLDLDGLTVRSIRVNWRPAAWSRDGAELTVTPSHGIRDHRPFVTRVWYDGVPETIDDLFGVSGFIHTDDGALVVGEPHVAATWFPVNDHPADKASYSLRITVPDGLEAVSNGFLTGRFSHDGWTTWKWLAQAPMASYLVGMGIGEFDLHAYVDDGIRYWDAIDPDLLVSPTPRTGEQFAISQQADLAYKRLSDTISVPDDGAELSFWVTRDTEPDWDYFFVEAHTAGVDDDWTTLPDLNGHASQDTGNVCPFWLELHPFLEHYQSAVLDPDPEVPPTCDPSGSSGDWWGASGESDGWEQWSVDLSAWAGSTVEVSLTYASDDIVQHSGVEVDDILVSTGEGTTSFEADTDPMDGWTVPGPPEDSPGNANDWIVGTEADTPPTRGEIVQGSFARQGEIVAFLGENFGPYPFRAGGGIVDHVDLAFALENQTRPIYSQGFFTDPLSGDNVIVHELAHQWFGDSLALERWQHIWLNEGFATYAEWLWSEREGLGTAQEVFDFFYGAIPADDPFWSLTIGDPGPEALFDFPVYARGAMTLHQLRLAVGDDDFFQILEDWASSNRYGNVTTDGFIQLAEQISGQQLDALFDEWLFTAEKPDLAAGALLRAGSLGADRDHMPAAARFLVERLGATMPS